MTATAPVPSRVHDDLTFRVQAGPGPGSRAREASQCTVRPREPNVSRKRRPGALAVSSGMRWRELRGSAMAACRIMLVPLHQVARAMANFGFSDLWIVGSEDMNFEIENDARCVTDAAGSATVVNPHQALRRSCRDCGTDEACRAMSMCGREVLLRARRVGTMREAVSDCSWVVGTSPRPSRFWGEISTPRRQAALWTQVAASPVRLFVRRPWFRLLRAGTSQPFARHTTPPSRPQCGQQRS
jgi:hypothetical protein